MPDYRRKMPHIHPENAYLFLTWRLWGSMPARTGQQVYPTPGHAFVAADRELDRRSSGPRWLSDPRVAKMVSEAIMAGEAGRQFYEVCAWVVMPNHVHILILPKVPVPVITRWLKGSTARYANLLLGRTGCPFWQDESFDHYLRRADQVGRTIEYIEMNPVSAGLAPAPEQWPWSSAGWQRHSPCGTG